MGKTFVTFVLDETGSMESIKDDTIGGFNTYIDGLAKSPDEILFTLIKFDSNHTDKVHVAVPVANVPHLTPLTYKPGASTPLIDASYKAIKATDERVKTLSEKPNVIVVIQTDGQENASVEFKNSDLVALIKEKTAEGWAFVFLGAGIDSFSVAGAMGISAVNTMTYDRTRSATAFAAVSASNMRFARSGVAMDAAWSDDERHATGGHMPPTTTTPAATTPKPTTKSKSIVEDIVL